MELLVEAFTQETEWNREQFLESRPEKNSPLALLRLSRLPQAVSVPVGHKVTILDPEDCVTEAASRLRRTYPDFTMRVSRETGLIDLYIWQGQISWWWFLAFSEKSSLRTSLIELLYWFCILEIILERYTIATVHLATDDVDYGCVLQALCKKHRVLLGDIHLLAQKPISGSKLILISLHRFVRAVLSRGLKWLTLKWLRLDSLINYEAIGTKSAVFCTFYPKFFEQRGDTDFLDEKLFGTWPRYLAHTGHPTVYAANTALNFKQIMGRAKMLRRHVACNNLAILESFWSLADLLKITLDFTFLWRYWRWRKRHADVPMLFQGVDIHRLVLRELDQDVFVKQEAPNSVGLSYATKRLIEKLGGASCVSYTFEYQPRERAISVGVHMTAKAIPIIGFQISIFSFNHLPWFFPKEETRQLPTGQHDARLAPLPDYVVAYGLSDYRVFKERFLPDTVILAGPIRYTQLAQDVRTGIDTDAFRQMYSIPDDAALFLVATSIIRAETLRMMHMTLKVVAALPGVYLLVKFHPHRPLHQELAEMTENVGFSNYQVFDSDLNTLIKASKVVILATSSVGIDAIALNCMPVVFYRSGNFEPHPLRDFPKAAFFCQDEAELKAALEECLREGELYQRRKAHWPRVIESLLYRLDGRENERLYEELKNRKVL